MLYWAHLAASWLLRALPVRWSYAISDTFSPYLSPLWRRQHRCAVENARKVLGPGASERAVHQSVMRTFRNYGRYMVDLLRLPHLCIAEVDRTVRYEGVEHIEEALARGQGLIIATAHIGNWDLAGALLTSRGYPVNVVVETLQPPRWNEQVQTIRARIGMRTIAIEHGVRDMLRALRANEILGLLVDRPVGDEGVAVTFFGAEARVPAGSATLAIRTGAEVVAAAVVREGRGYTALVSRPLASDLSGDHRARVAQLTQRIFSWHEEVVRRYPDQWYMFRAMWAGAEPSASS